MYHVCCKAPFAKKGWRNPGIHPVQNCATSFSPFLRRFVGWQISPLSTHASKGKENKNTLFPDLRRKPWLLTCAVCLFIVSRFWFCGGGLLAPRRTARNWPSTTVAILGPSASPQTKKSLMQPRGFGSCLRPTYKGRRQQKRLKEGERRGESFSVTTKSLCHKLHGKKYLCTHTRKKWTFNFSFMCTFAAPAAIFDLRKKGGSGRGIFFIKPLGFCLGRGCFTMLECSGKWGTQCHCNNVEIFWRPRPSNSPRWHFAPIFPYSYVKGRRPWHRGKRETFALHFPQNYNYNSNFFELSQWKKQRLFSKVLFY